MRVGKELRSPKELLSVHCDIWAFEISGKMYVQTLARVEGTLYWTITKASGSLSKPDRVFCIASGFAETRAEEDYVLAGPLTLLKSLKEGLIKANPHTDKAAADRDKETASLLKLV